MTEKEGKTLIVALIVIIVIPIAIIIITTTNVKQVMHSAISHYPQSNA